MRGLISTTAVAATALLLAGCDRTADPAANDSVNASLSAPTNEVDPDVDDNSFGIPELGPGNVVQNSEDPAVNAAADR
jgi:PBP1b-binding outer membrane lipoprotein LpoB